MVLVWEKNIHLSTIGKIHAKENKNSIFADSENIMNKALADKIEANSKEYERLLKDEKYTDVQFNPETGGLKATHINHNFDDVNGIYERNVQKIGFADGNSIILESEKGKPIGQRYTEGLWNGKPFEIAGSETGTSNNMKKGLNHCAEKPNVRVAVLYFPNDNFDISTFENAFARFEGVGKSGGKGYVKFEEIYCIGNNKILYKKKAT